MINVKPDIQQALENNAALVALLGGEKRIDQLKAPNADEYPRITFFEMTNFDSDYADDAAIASTIHVQVDIWSKGNPNEIAQEVDTTMKSLGFVRYSGADLYEEDTKVYHKAMRFRIKKEI